MEFTIVKVVHHVSRLLYNSPSHLRVKIPMYRLC